MCLPILNLMLRLARPPLAALLSGGHAGTGEAPGRLPRQAKGRLLAFLCFASGITLLTDLLGSDDPRQHRELGIVLAVLALVLSVGFWLIPWRRLPHSASLVFLPVAFGLLALGNYADPNPYTYGLPFVTVYLWIGASHPRWTSVASLPIALAAFIGPLLTMPDAAGSWIGTTVFTLGLCVTFGEALAWIIQRHALDSQVQDEGQTLPEGAVIV